MSEHRMSIRSTSQTIRVICSCGLNERVTDRWAASIKQRDHMRATVEPFAHDDDGKLIAIKGSDGTVRVIPQSD